MIEGRGRHPRPREVLWRRGFLTWLMRCVIFSPPLVLAGRAAAVWVRQGDLEFLVLAAYAPPRPSLASIGVVKQIVEWLRQPIEAAGTRPWT